MLRTMLHANSHELTRVQVRVSFFVRRAFQLTVPRLASAARVAFRVSGKVPSSEGPPLPD